MTIPSEVSRNDYLGNGTADTYDFNFRIFAATDLLVTQRDTDGIETTLTYPTDYSVTGVGSYDGGSITLTAGNLTSGYALTIRRVRPLTQGIDLRNQGGFFAETHEDAFDDARMVDLQQQDEIDRSIKIPETEVGGDYDLVIPTAAQRANKYHAYDADGNVIASAGTGADSGLREDLGEDDGAVLVTFKQSAASSVARSVRSKLRDVASVLDFGAVGDGDTDDTTAIQNALDSELYVTFPKGNFLISDELVVRPWSRLVGAGKSDYIAALTDTIAGTRIIQTTANKVFTTNTGTPANDAAGSIHISHLTVLGGTVSAPIGTYGIYCTSSARMILEDVHAYFFTESGLYFIGGLMATLRDCVAQYCQDAGLFLDYGNFGASDANSYMSNIIGGNFRQNGNAGVRLGTSTVKVNLIGVDVESTGNYYAGDGYGVEITGGARGVVIDGCWLEGNKVHVVVGDDAGSRNTVPINTVIRDTQLWSVSSGDEKIRLNSGVGTIIENNEFDGNSSITVKVLSNNPIIRNNSGDFSVKDENDNNVTVDSVHMHSVLPSPVLTGWTTSNCSIAVDEDEDSPAGPLPVYKITPAGAGTVRITMPLATFAWAEVHNTIGAYLKSSTPIRAKYFLATTSPSATYTSDNDQHDFTIGTEWSWHTVGKCIPDTAGGNLTLRIDVEVTTTDPFWVTGVSAVNGISYKPYRLPAAGIQALGSPLGTPSVYGKTRCVTSGTNDITDLTDGSVGQVVTIIAEHALTITDGTNIFLSGSTNFVMAVSDTLTLIRKADGKWYEIGRSDNT